MTLNLHLWISRLKLERELIIELIDELIGDVMVGFLGELKGSFDMQSVWNDRNQALAYFMKESNCFPE